jgi:serine/threonine-protein phosphatase 6 regulatory ankyrin repeat subunit B
MIKDQYTELAKFFLACGAKVNVKNSRGNSPLHIAAAWGKAEIVDALLTAGAEVNIWDFHHRTPLLHAVTGEDADAKVSMLLARRAKVNMADDQGITPLMKAAYRGKVVMVQALLTHGAEVNAKAKDGKTALAWAANSYEAQKRKDNAEVARLLLEAGAEVDARDN